MGGGLGFVGVCVWDVAICYRWCYIVVMMLHRDMTLRETIEHLIATEREARSRFRWGSPCRFVRTIDIVCHIVVPELIEDVLPRVARYLRSTSPRWGRSWREWD